MHNCENCDYDDEGNSEGCSGPAKEEPDCYACNDRGCPACGDGPPPTWLSRFWTWVRDRIPHRRMGFTDEPPF
jgi:hypothetical protein